METKKQENIVKRKKNMSGQVSKVGRSAMENKIFYDALFMLCVAGKCKILVFSIFQFYKVAL